VSSDTPNPNSGALKKGRCPRCGTKFEYSSVAEHKFFPFCSPRCRDVDLGNWMSGKYAIPGESIKSDSAPQDDENYDGT
jgi:uncharacterized protein